MPQDSRGPLDGTTDTEPLDVLSPQVGKGEVWAGRYALGDVLGQGGMGVVFLARDRVLNEDVAIKLLRGEFASDRRWRERLAREVRLARQLRHPNVCRVFDFGRTEDGQVFVVMERARGTLRDELEGAAPADRPFADRLADVRAVTAGLAVIHEAGIVHRDVSSRNILRCADGRLVVADFGLAIDANETTASVQGGTVAYMAPELAVGGRASFASDVWSLAIIIHEVLFGQRPSWVAGIVGRGMQPPRDRLTTIERAVWNICRDCTAEDPARRPSDGSVVVERLRDIEAPRTGRWIRRMAMAVAAGAAVLATLLVANKRLHHKDVPQSSPSSTAIADPVIAVRGVPADWTQSSRVLASVPGRIYCLLALPDHRTLRFVWGAPRIAEDIDIPTGRRRPSPLVPESYAVGCPDLSPNGQRLIFQGYDDAKRPVIFRSSQPDGSRATAVVQAADPRYSSTPKWFAGGNAFVFDLDDNHPGIIEGTADHLTVANTQPSAESFFAGWILDNTHIYLVGLSTQRTAQFRVLEWPLMNLVLTFVLPAMPSDCAMVDPSTIYCNDRGHEVLAIHPTEHSAVALGSLPRQTITFLAPDADALAFVSYHQNADLWEGPGSGNKRRLTSDGSIYEAAACGDGVFLVTRAGTRDDSVVTRLSQDGNLTNLTGESFYQSPVCARAGAEWWFERAALTDPGFFHCTTSGCTLIGHGVIRGAALSPDGTRIAYLAPTNRGMGVRVMSKFGDNVRDLADSETACPPGWSSNHTLWVSRRRREKIIWTEIDANTGAETARIVPGGRDCTDGEPDPQSPATSNFRVISERQSQIRWQRLP